MGTIGGRNVYRYPVSVKLNDSRSDLVETLGTIGSAFYRITAFTAADAANAIRDLYRHRPETEIVAYGPFGGETYRYVGWDSAIYAGLVDRPWAGPRLPFDGAGDQELEERRAANRDAARGIPEGGDHA
jgi:hypothetical protein